MLLAAAWLGASGARAESSGGWKLSKIDGEDYVSMNSVKKFYGFTKLARDGNRVTLENPKILVTMTCGSRECEMNGVKFVFCKPVQSNDGESWVSRVDLAKLIDPVLRPNFIKEAGNFQTVILDPGHGGKDAGATNSLGTEAAYNLKVARKAKELLTKSGYKVILTRDKDVYITLQDRVNIANAIKQEALFISIHFNSGGRNARGIETFTLSPPGIAHYGRGEIASDALSRAGNEHDSANIALATSVHGSLLRRLGKYTFDRGIKRARFSVLSGVRHPAILMECGFISHPYEARLIDHETYQNTLGNAILDAVTKYRFAVGGKPIAQR
ncbi:MAG: N-acetylmuramoyl-L-alanine amidase [Verrucomicrobiota bacterium]